MDFIDWLVQGGGYVVLIVGTAASLGAIINHVREWTAARKKPHNDLVAAVEGLEQRFDSFKDDATAEHRAYEARFKRDLQRHEKNAEESKIILRSLLTIIKSSIDGNHKDELKERQNEIQQYLIEKA